MLAGAVLSNELVAVLILASLLAGMLAGRLMWP
jgi:hypothetical protein